MRTFDPWKGELYDRGIFGIRLLILGESHYGKPSNITPGETIRIVRELAQGARFRFFTKVQKLVLGTRGWIPDAERVAFWERVAYCNYIQTFPGNEPRIRPTEEMWMAGREPLLQTVRELAPQMVLVLGKDLQGRLPDLPIEIHVCKVSHPSGRGFKYDLWQPLVRSAIIAAGGQIPAALSKSSDALV